jgi:hypothetical protein
MQPEIRFTPFEYTSSKSQNGYDCLRVNFDYANAGLKAKLKALGMRWAPEGKYFYFMVAEGKSAAEWETHLRADLVASSSPLPSEIQASTSTPHPGEPLAPPLQAVLERFMQMLLVKRYISSNLLNNSMNVFKYLWGLTLIIFLTSCSENTLSKNDVEQLVDENGVEITDTTEFENSEILRVYEDHGFAGTSYYLFHKKGSDYYHKLPLESKYTSGQVWSNYILQTCSYMGQASDSGQWIKVEKRITASNQEEIRFDYRKEILNDQQDDCLYKKIGGKLVLIDSLNKYCSIHDLDTGLYYLSPPGIFYTNKVDIKDLEKEYE